jgi:membrane protein required for colicin V production
VNVLDIVLGSLLLFGIVRGLMKGLFVEVASIAALILGVYGAIHFSDFAASFLMERVDWDENYVNITAFAITFIAIVVVIALAGKALTKIADFASLGILNKLLGGLFGALKVGLILSIILIIFSKMNRNIPLIEDHEMKDSMLYEPVRSLAPIIFPSILEDKESASTT